MKRHTCIDRNGGGGEGGCGEEGAPLHLEMHNIYHILYLNPLLECSMRQSDVILVRSSVFFLNRFMADLSCELVFELEEVLEFECLCLILKVS